jgi:DTW domain-containing protein
MTASTWFVYIIRTDDDQLYTGITTDIKRRWQEHARGRAGARYFRGRMPTELCLLEEHPDRSSATRREIAIKQLNRQAKEELISRTISLDVEGAFPTNPENMPDALRLEERSGRGTDIELCTAKLPLNVKKRGSGVSRPSEAGSRRGAYMDDSQGSEECPEAPGARRGRSTACLKMPAMLSSAPDGTLSPQSSVKRNRQYCSNCAVPKARCICPWVRDSDNQVQVVILQHPKEAGMAKNTAGLLHLSLSNSELHVGEAFPTELLDRLISDDKTNLLLYPDNTDPALPKPPVFDWSESAPENLRLIVLDGTWRKSRKMLYLNPALQQLPRMALTNPAPSAYRIRTAPKPGHLSTLEASCYALALLEKNQNTYRPLLAAFSDFIDQHAALNAITQRTNHPNR